MPPQTSGRCAETFDERRYRGGCISLHHGIDPRLRPAGKLADLRENAAIGMPQTPDSNPGSGTRLAPRLRDGLRSKRRD
jgi:hypothetical protein